MIETRIWNHTNDIVLSQMEEFLQCLFPKLIRRYLFALLLVHACVVVAIFLKIPPYLSEQIAVIDLMSEEKCL